MKRKKKAIFFCLFYIFYLSSAGLDLFAEHEFHLRAASALDVPYAIPEFGAGFGVDLSLDWAFSRFAKNLNFGISTFSSIVSLPFETGDPLVVLGGFFGPFLHWKPLDRLAFIITSGGGVYQYARGEKKAVNLQASGSFGFEFLLSPYLSLYADSSYTYRVFTGNSWNDVPLNSIGAALGIRLNLTEIMTRKARIRLEKTHQYRIFPVSWAWYENNPVANVTLTNEEANAITDVNLSFFIDSFMSQPFTFAVIPRIGAGDSIEVPVTALFNEAMMNLTESITANGTIQVFYRSLGARKESTFTVSMPIYHRNALSWDDNRRAAAFVSPRDSAVRFFIHYVTGAVETISQQINTTLADSVPQNVMYAAALFETLRLYGITYVTVPATSFVSVSSNESVLDNVSYPYQALYYRGGDCSYLSILFCSMLEALNIESAFITIPGHIYIAFDVGDDSWNYNSEDIIRLNGKRWLPVEITVPGQGFTRAWRIGALQWRNNLYNEHSEKSTLYPIREAWEIYPSVTVPASGDELPVMPEWAAIKSALLNELQELNFGAKWNWNGRKVFCNK